MSDLPQVIHESSANPPPPPPLSHTESIFPDITPQTPIDDATTSSTHDRQDVASTHNIDNDESHQSPSSRHEHKPSHPYFTFPQIHPFHITPHTIISSLRQQDSSSSQTPQSRRISSGRAFEGDSAGAFFGVETPLMGGEHEHALTASKSPNAPPSTPQRSLLQKNYVTAPTCTQIFLSLLYYASKERCQEEIGRYLRWWTPEDLWWGQELEHDRPEENNSGEDNGKQADEKKILAPVLQVESAPEEETSTSAKKDKDKPDESLVPETKDEEMPSTKEPSEEEQSTLATTTTTTTNLTPLQIKTSGETRKRKRSELLLPKPSPPRKLLRTNSTLSPLHHIRHRVPQALQLSHFEETYKQYLDHLIKDESAVFDISVSFWIDSLVHLKDEFVKVAHDSFYTNVLQQDFTRELGIARHTLNQWIDKETRGKINVVFEERDLSPGTQSVLLSALTFHGQFKFEFPRVTMGNFHALQHGTEETVVSCEMMERLKCREIYGEEQTFTWISLPYSEERYHLLIMLPREGMQLAEHYDVSSIIKKATLPDLHKTNMSRVCIPKFEVRSQFNVAQHFKRGGITSIFNREIANLQEVTEDHLVLNHVVQEVFFNTIELGTHQSASVSMSSVAGWKEFVACKSFAFAVYDSRTESVLFDGALYDPTVTEKVVFE